MKKSYLKAPYAALTAFACAAIPQGSLLAQDTEPAVPVGSLDAYPAIVQTGTHPTLTWSIQYPERVIDIIDVDEDTDEVTAIKDLCADVRVLGASYQIGWTKEGKPVWGYVQAEISIGSQGWDQFFFTTQDKLSPVPKSYSVAAGEKINIRGRAYTGSYWKPWISTGVVTENVVALRDGERPPSTVPAYNQDNIESFLRPYTDADGTIKIGPKDVIYLMELGQTDTSRSGFDLQDLVVLVTYDDCKTSNGPSDDDNGNNVTGQKTNNGHGNNIDGVDSSNPGNAPFIQFDSDPNVDDEGSGGGAYPGLK